MKNFSKLLSYLFILFIFGCMDGKESVKPETRSLTRKTADYDGVAAHEWIQTGYQMMKDNQLSGPQAARTCGYMGFTLWESVYGGIPGAKNMAGQVNDYFEAERIDPNLEYDWVIVLASAMRLVMPELIEKISSAQKTIINLQAELQENQRLAKGVSEMVRDQSKKLGNMIGQRIVWRMRRDGRDVIRGVVPVLPARTANTPWYWDGKILNQVPIEPMWGTLRTFILENARGCEAEAPRPYSISAADDFYKEAKEIFDVPRNNINKSMAYHWENGAGRTSGAGGHWVSITQQLLKERKRNLAECAKAYCLIGFAASDAYSNSWFTKYKYNLMRPITFIREQFDANWSGIIYTPPYPDYISVSAVMGGVAPIILIPVLGDVAFVDRTHLGSALYTPDGGPFILPERNFDSLTKAGEEQAFSRILGGVGFRRSCEMGLQSGRCIGTTILSRIDFGD